MIEDPSLLLKAARTSIVEVWKILVAAVEAAGQGLLQRVGNTEAIHGCAS